MTTAIFHIPDMSCASCVMHLEALEDKLKGVEMVDANYRKQRIIVDYNENVIDQQDIIAAVKKEGYTAIPVTKGDI